MTIKDCVYIFTYASIKILNSEPSDIEAHWVASSLVTTLYLIGNSVYADIHMHRVAS